MAERSKAGYHFMMRRVVQDASSGVWSIGGARDIEESFSGLRYKSISGLHSYGECKSVYEEDYAEEDGVRVWTGSSAYVDSGGGELVSVRSAVDIKLSLYFFSDDESDMIAGAGGCGENYHAFMDWLGNDGMVIWEDDLRCRVALMYLSEASEPNIDNLCGIQYIGVELTFANVLGRTYAVGDYGAIEDWLGLDDGAISSSVDIPSYSGGSAVVPDESGYSFIMRRVVQDADSGGWSVGSAVDLEDSFAGLRYKSFSGLHNRGKGKVVYADERAEVEGEDVWTGSSSLVDGSYVETGSVRSASDMTLSLHFFSTASGTQAEEARSCGDNYHAFMDWLGSDGFVLYEDGLRRRCCLMYLNDAVEPSIDNVSGKAYICVSLSFANATGRTYAYGDYDAINEYLALGEDDAIE